MENNAPNPPIPAKSDTKEEIFFACRITKTGTQVGDVILAKGTVVRLPRKQIDALVAIGAAEFSGI